MDIETLNLAELKILALGFDRAQMRDVHIVKDGEDYLSKRHMGVWNVNKGELACLAPKSYTVIQHRHATECLIEAITSLNIKALAGLKRSRHGIQLDFDFPDSKIELTEVGESFTTGIRVVSDYSQVAGLMITARVTRLACSNAMVVNDLVKPTRIRYTEQLTLTVAGLIDKVIKDLLNSDRKLAEMVRACREDSVEWQAVKLLTKAMFQKKKHVGEILSRLKHDDHGRVTRWDFYNAITKYASLGLRLKPEIDAWLQNKAQKVIKTPFGQLTEELVTTEINGSP